MFDLDENIEATLQRASEQSLLNKRWGIKIIVHQSTTRSALNEIVYYNKGFVFQSFIKWQWFFQYRAALLKVQNPKCFVEIMQFSYEIKNTEELIAKRKKDIISARRAKLTIIKKRLQQYQKNANSQLFGTDYDERYKNTLDALGRYEQRLKEAESKHFQPTI